MVSGGITEGILLIASIIVAAGLSAAVISKATAIDSAFTASTEAQKDITLTKIKIVYATGLETSSVAKVWVKNVGANPINNPEKIDVYFGTVGSAERIPYNASGTDTEQHWKFADNVSQWLQKDTVDILIDNGAADLLEDTTYIIRISTPNGIVDEYYFAVSNVAT